MRDEDEALNIDEGNHINITSVDDPNFTETLIMLGCHRETRRLERVLRVYQKAITVATEAGRGRWLRGCLLGLHDHKGQLTATWHDRVVHAPHCPKSGSPLVYLDLEAAWEDECEAGVTHRLSEDFNSVSKRHSPSRMDDLNKR